MTVSLTVYVCVYVCVCVCVEGNGSVHIITHLLLAVPTCCVPSTDTIRYNTSSKDASSVLHVSKRLNRYWPGRHALLLLLRLAASY